MSEQFENNTPEVELTDTPVEEVVVEEPVAKETPATTPARPVTRRYNKKGKRRGKYAFAAPVGFLVSILSIVGVIAIIANVVGYIRDKQDTTALEKELYYYLQPLLVYSPDPFSDAAKSSQDAFLSAACYKVMIEEQNRMQYMGNENDENDENGYVPLYDIETSLNCYFVPQEVVEEAYHELFGSKAKLTHRAVKDNGIEYSKTEKYYLIPIGKLDTGHEMVIDELEVYRDRYEVRVGFVPKVDIKYDKYGEPIEPTSEQATHFQTYTLIRNKEAGTYYIKSCTTEKK